MVLIIIMVQVLVVTKERRDSLSYGDITFAGVDNAANSAANLCQTCDFQKLEENVAITLKENAIWEVYVH